MMFDFWPESDSLYGRACISLVLFRILYFLFQKPYRSIFIPERISKAKSTSALGSKS